MRTLKASLMIPVMTLLTSGFAAADSVLVNFAPPKGTVVREYRMAAQTTVDGEPGLSNLVHTRREIAISGDARGWSFFSTPVDVRIDGLPGGLDRDILELLLSQAFTMNLTLDGQLRSVSGFDSLDDDVRRLIPSAIRPAVSRVLNQSTQKQRVAAHWETEMAWLFGQEISPGQVHTLQRVLVQDRGLPMNFHQQSTIRSLDQNNGHGVVTIDFENTATPVDTPGAANPLRALSVTESGWRTVRVDTGMPLEEEATRLITVSLQDGSREITQVRTETRRITHHSIQPGD